MINVNDFEKYENEIASVKNNAAELWRVLAKYTGPDVGTEWDDEAMTLSIVPGWHVDEDGFVVRD